MKLICANCGAAYRMDERNLKAGRLLCDRCAEVILLLPASTEPLPAKSPECPVRLVLGDCRNELEKQESEATARDQSDTALPLDGSALEAVLSRLPRLEPALSDEGAAALQKDSLPVPRTGTVATGVFPPPEPTEHRPPAAANAEPADEEATPLLQPPEPRVVLAHPDGTVDLAGPPRLVLLGFNQPVDAATLLKGVHTRNGTRFRKRPVPVQLASVEEVESDPSAKRLAEAVGQGRWVAFRGVEPWEAGTRVAVKLRAGTPVAPGAARLRRSFRFGFTTEGKQEETPPFRVVHQDRGCLVSTITLLSGLFLLLGFAVEWCLRNLALMNPALLIEYRVSWLIAGAVCLAFGRLFWEALKENPDGALYIQFSNELDLAALDASWVQVEPGIPGLSVSAEHGYLALGGPLKPRTNYRVTLSRAIRDVHGQTLGREERVTRRVGRPFQRLEVRGATGSTSFVVLDPAASLHLPVLSRRYRGFWVRFHAVEPSLWAQYLEYYKTGPDSKRTVLPPGRHASRRYVRVSGCRDSLSETPVDLTPALPGGTGNVVVVIESGLWFAHQIHAMLWVQVTRIGLNAALDSGRLIAWASTLEDSRPLEGVAVTLASASAVTGPDGMASLTLSDEEPDFLLARRGDDVAFLPRVLTETRREEKADECSWKRRPDPGTLRWYVADNRGTYRPGETVKVKGWIRRLGAGCQGDLELPGTPGPVHCLVTDAVGNEVCGAEATLNHAGGFDLAANLPASVNLGAAQMHFSLGQSGVPGVYTHKIRVEEYRRPEFEVRTSLERGPCLPFEQAVVRADVSYFSGDPLRGAAVVWEVFASAADYQPPGRPDFQFRMSSPSRPSRSTLPFLNLVRGAGAREDGAEPASEEDLPSLDRSDSVPAGRYVGVTNVHGFHRLQIDVLEAPPKPVQIEAEASVADVDRQSWSAKTQFLIHPSSLYIGLRCDHGYVAAGAPLEVAVIVTDIDGHAVPGQKVTLRATRLPGGEAHAEHVIDSGMEPVISSFQPDEGGLWRLSATVADAKGRHNESAVERWVGGGTQQSLGERLEPEEARLIPDRGEYRPGDRARILVVAPFSPAEGLLTARRSGLLRTERFTMDGPEHTLIVELEDVHVPTLHLRVDLNRAVPLSGRMPNLPDGSARGNVQVNPGPPVCASGSLALKVSHVERDLAVEILPHDQKLPPGAETNLDVTVRDAAGCPVPGADVAVVVADEAVLALSNYRLPDPLDRFYAPVKVGVHDLVLRDLVHRNTSERTFLRPGSFGLIETASGGPLLVRARQASEGERSSAAQFSASRLPEAGQLTGTGMAPLPSIRVRQDFPVLALFIPSLLTDQRGLATFPFKLPDSVTRYRVMAVVASKSRQFGSADAAVTTSLPLRVRPAPPRFLNYGDRFELPVLIHNQTEGALDVDVAVEAANAQLLGGAGLRVKVPPQDRIEVRFPVATAGAGNARFQAAAVAGQWSDAAAIQLPVWTPASTDVHAVYGILDAGTVAQSLVLPAGVLPNVGGLEITTASTALHALTDAFIYLVDYPFECAEQRASRLLGMAALRDVLAAFHAGGLPDEAAMVDQAGRDVQALRGIQNTDGGFPLWRRDTPSWPFVTIHPRNGSWRG